MAANKMTQGLDGALVQSVGYFPEPLPGELVYSVLARLRRHTGSMPTSKFLIALYGSRMPSQNIALPTRLAALAERIPAQYGLNALSLVHGHTLFNYYARFAAPENREAALRRMLDGSGMAQKPLRVSIMIPGPTSLRFCRECATEMTTRYGELYWRREHQIPAVLVCPFHRCVLRHSKVRMDRHLRHLIPATTEMCTDDSPPVLPQMSDADLRDMGGLASDCVDILVGRDRFNLNGEQAAEFYLRLLSGKALTLTNGRVSTRSYSDHVSRELRCLKPVWPQLFSARERRYDWLTHMNHGHGSQDTTFMILALTVAERLPDKKPKRDADIAVFGPGPWPCRNPIGGHMGKLTIKRPVINRVDGCMVARFSCKCGYIYTQRRYPDGRLNSPRLQTFGKTLRPHLLKALTSGWTAGYAARLAGIGTGTLICAAREMGEKTPWVMGKMRKSCDPGGEWAKSKARQARKLKDVC